MAYCGPRGIDLDEFLERSTYSQAAALAWQAHESQRCSGCGTHPDDWDESKGGKRHAWQAVIRNCEGCVRTEMVGRTDEAKRPGARIHMMPG